MAFTIINAVQEKVLHIGKRGESLVTWVDFGAFIEECKSRMGEGVFTLAHERAEDGAPYLIQPADGRYWVVKDSDLQFPGTGWLEAVYTAGPAVKKSLRWKTVTLTSLGETVDPPPAWQSYVERVTQLVDGVYNMGVTAHESDTPTVTKSTDSEGRVQLDFGLPKGQAYDDTALRQAVDRLDRVKADKSELPDVSNLATKAELSTKADRSEIPDISGLATKAETGELKSALSELERQNDALWKLSKGIVYDFEQDTAEGYEKAVPSGGKEVTVQNIGGKTLVFSQLLGGIGVDSNIHKYSDAATIEDGVVSIESPVQNSILIDIRNITFRANRSYLFMTSIKAHTSVRALQVNDGSGWVIAQAKGDDTYHDVAALVTFSSDVRGSINVRFGQDGRASNFTPYSINAIKIYDVTGNTFTAEEWLAMFPDWKNAPISEPTLMNFSTDKVVSRGRNMYPGLNVTFPVKAGNYYVSSAETPDTTRADFAFFDKDGNTTVDGIVVGKAYATMISGNNLFRLSANMTKLQSAITITNPSVVAMKIYGTYTTYNEYKDVQVERGDSKSTYKPYHDPIAFDTAALASKYFPNGMKSAGTVYDELDLVNKVAIQRVGSVVLNGTETWYDWGSGTPKSHGMYFDSAKINENNAKAKVVSAIYITVVYTDAFGGVIDKSIAIGNYNNRPMLEICDKAYDGVSAWKNYLASNSVEVLYELAEPIITPITEDIDPILPVEGGGSLTFKNDKGDDYRVPVPNSEEYFIALNEVVS